jgi:hypothetical protein
VDALIRYSARMAAVKSSSLASIASGNGTSWPLTQVSVTGMAASPRWPWTMCEWVAWQCGHSTGAWSAPWVIGPWMVILVS